MLRRILMPLLAATLMCAIVFLPVNSSTEDTETTMLAQTLYALARDEGYDTQLAIGSLIMNRMVNDSFPDTLEGVLSQQHQFPRGMEFDEEALRAARDCMSGVRTLPGYVLYFKHEDSAECWNSSGFFCQQGAYQFFIST